MYRRRMKWLVMVGCLPAMAWAAEPTVTVDASTVQDLLALATGKAAAASAEAEPVSFKDLAKDMEAQKGLFTLWSYPAGAKDKDPERLLCEVPASFLGQQFMLSTSISGGGFYTGFPLDEYVVMWKLHGDTLMLIQPDTLHVTDPKEEVASVVNRTYPDRILAAVPVLARTEAGNPVFDLGGLLKSNFADIAWMSMVYSPYLGMTGGGGITPALSTWEKKKAFELNVEITVALAVQSSNPPGSHDKKLVHFSFWKLPETGYAPRVADQRVGYFLSAHMDWSKPTEARELFDRYVDRWQLEKRDPSLKMCEPKQPIVFYIEKTVPIQYRRAVREGILEWNKAFEKIGFVNAIEVRQQTADNEWKDLDPEDMRYAFIRWIVTGAGFAMGPHRSNPYTGQIYDGDIVFDDSMLRYASNEGRREFDSHLLSSKFSDPSLAAFVEAYPEYRPRQAAWMEMAVGHVDDFEQLQAKADQHLSERGYHGCRYAEGMRHQLQVAGTWLATQPPEVRERVVQQMLKEVVTHEVGHVLGLRHNFKASSIYQLDEIKKRRLTGEAMSGSIMDYNPLLIFEGDDEHADELQFVTPTIGPYDYWAIEYGYRPFDGSYKPKAEADKPEESEPEKTPAAPIAQSNAMAQADPSEEVLAKMPPEIREKVKALMASATDATPSDPGSTKISKPKVKSPNADEASMLTAIASRYNEPELVYLSDEDAWYMSPDPSTARFDAGADPIAWATARLAQTDARLKEILEWSVKDGEAWYYLQNDFLSLMFDRLQVLDYVGKFVGGQYVSRSHRGDPHEQAPFVLVEPQLQRDALKFIADNLYRDDFFGLDPDVLNHLAVPRWWHAGVRINMMGDFPVMDLVSMMQWWNLYDRLTPNVIRRIQDAEFKTDAADKFTVAEYLQTLRDDVWSDALQGQRLNQGEFSDAKPFISTIRRSLQRQYLSLVEPMVRERPGRGLSPDQHAMLTYCLQDLSEQIGKRILSQAEKLDFASRAHLTMCKSRIDRMLSADLSELAPPRYMYMMMGQTAEGAR